MAANAAKIQQIIKRNNDELHDYVDDLAKWEKEIKSEKSGKDNNEPKKVVPPVRNSSKTKKSNEEPKTRIKSYDYDRWSKFDVDQACEDVDIADGSDSDSEDNLEMLLQQSLQKATMEKEKGNTHFKLGEYDESISCYSNGILLDPKNAILYANRAMALLKLNKYGAAESDCTKALEIDHTYIKAFLRKATALEKMNKCEEALECYKQILQLEADHSLATREAKRLINLTSVKKTQSRRHKTPLTRITINEINTAPEKVFPMIVESNHVEMGVENIKIRNETKSTATKIESRNQYQRLTKVPRNAFEFEKELVKIKQDQEMFCEFMDTIPLKSYTTLMKQSIENILPFLVKYYATRLKTKGQNCLDELQTLLKVPRFDVAMMFLSSENKQDIKALFESLKNSEHFQANTIQFNNLQKQYCKM